MIRMRLAEGEHVLTACDIEAMGGPDAELRRRALLRHLNEEEDVD